MLELRNPHSVLAALEMRPKAVRSIRVSSHQTGTPWDEVAKVAARKSIPISVRRAESGPKQRRDAEGTGAGWAN
ncbi:MAG: 23S rRNA (guanosine(2251)-2'-O)-methyltransferase RlmB, partial [Fuerstiella sp.]